jgi:hypothetical protein
MHCSDVCKESFSGREPNWVEFAKAWSPKANGRTIFYKTPEHLKSYDNKWVESRVFANTVLINHDLVQRVRSTLQSKRRRHDVPPAHPFTTIPSATSSVDMLLPIPQVTVPTNLPMRSRILLPQPSIPTPQRMPMPPKYGRKARRWFHCGSDTCKGASQRKHCPNINAGASGSAD